MLSVHGTGKATGNLKVLGLKHLLAALTLLSRSHGHRAGCNVWITVRR
jgi:hypothetical protein